MATLEMNRGGQLTGNDNIFHEALTMALGILVQRIQNLPKEDQDELYDLMKEITKAEDEETLNSIVVAMREVLDQAPVRFQRMNQTDEQVPGARLQRWLDFVSSKIKEHRKNVNLTQEELAEKSGLPQSHISRLESGKHSPSRATLERIAMALGVSVSVFDPSA